MTEKNVSDIEVKNNEGDVHQAGRDITTIGDTTIGEIYNKIVLPEIPLDNTDDKLLDSLNNNRNLFFAFLFAIGAFFDAATTMLGTHSILSGTASGNNESFVIGGALVFALLITVILASSGHLLTQLNKNIFRDFVVLPTIIVAFVYDYYTSVLGVADLILGENSDLFNMENTNALLIILLLSLFMSLSPYIATTLWSGE